MTRKAVLVIVGLVLSALAAGSFGTDLQGQGERKQRPPAEETEEAEEQKPAEKPPAKSVRVRGQVVDKNGEPQPQARVRFAGPASGSASTGPDGAFRFEGPAGEYTVTVEIGGRSQSFGVQVTENGLQPAELVFTQ